MDWPKSGLRLFMRSRCPLHLSSSMSISSRPRSEHHFQFLRQIVLEYKHLNSVSLARVFKEVARVIAGILWRDDRELPLLAIDVLYDITMLQLRVPAHDAVKVLKRVIEHSRNKVLELNIVESRSMNRHAVVSFYDNVDPFMGVVIDDRKRK